MKVRGLVVTLAKSVAGVVTNPWAQFCANVDGGRVVVEVSTSRNVAIVVVKQLCYVSFFYKVCLWQVTTFADQVAYGALAKATVV